jgi:hypothetical protein
MWPFSVVDYCAGCALALAEQQYTTHLGSLDFLLKCAASLLRQGPAFPVLVALLRRLSFFVEKNVAGLVQQSIATSRKTPSTIFTANTD